MCRVSDKIKLCTCEFDYEKVKHYWAFSRYNSKKDFDIMGTSMLPAEISPEDEKFNQQLLSKLLNEGNVFDTDLKPKTKDRLYLSFFVKNSKYNDRIYYGFEFKKGKWSPTGYDPFEWEFKHDEEKSGRIKSALQRNSAPKQIHQ